MIKGSLKATPEHIYKAFNYDKKVQEAYELGRKDEREGINEKENSSSIDGVQAAPSQDAPEPEKGESDRSFFKRVALKNLQKAMGR